jgi:PncC family amidohydrolase
MDLKEIIETVSKIKQYFTKHSLNLSVAESCTGGLICHYLTMIPGAGKFFTGGIVVYSEGSKHILNISEKTIETYGVISDVVAKEMAKGCLELFKTDYSIATTGNLGPTVLENKEKGLIYIAICNKTEVFVREIRLEGNRLYNKEVASYSALKSLLNKLV